MKTAMNRFRALQRENREKWQGTLAAENLVGVSISHNRFLSIRFGRIFLLCIFDMFEQLRCFKKIHCVCAGVVQVMEVF